MAAPAEMPARLLLDGQSLVDEVRARPNALVYFLGNVGDGDAQVVLLPSRPTSQPRQIVVVDAAVGRKVPKLFRP